MRSIRKVVVLGANGAMGSGSGAVFAAAGIPTVFLARTIEKAEAGRTRAEQLTKGKVSAKSIACGTYSQDLGHALADADLVFEAVAEDLAAKREVFELIDKLRRDDSIVATVSSGLSIGAMCADRSASFRKNFLGIHFFNPPTVIVGCELIPHASTDPGVVAVVRDFLTSVVGREVVETRDTPAFAGNRLGFKVLNEVAQLAEEHGAAFMDQLVGPHTGRALPPLATIDLVGWDVHKAIVDNLYASTHDVAHAQFKLPAYMQRGIDRGHLGRKTRDKGGFFRVEGKGADAKTFVLDARSGDYRPLSEVSPPMPTFVEKMKSAIKSGRHTGAMEVLCTAEGKEAELLRKVLLGYISYGLGLVGEVVERPRDIDRIMGFGFNWAPPSVLVDAIGPGRTIVLLEKAQLPVPMSILEAATHQRPLFNEPAVDTSRFFFVAA
ncbi:MAG: 3-hydroxyacyl-CoA dehydrogenase family protein [Deltaproteobacteria bacterium]|nr:3-hydroxyacyl-CoA dehydrogenase family protein [Deltaproteobacteria bacterium]MDQ3297669.1 3-hydroxyacyl-CoA dehydrogenase family protein [Myxococcota bacterium]